MDRNDIAVGFSGRIEQGLVPRQTIGRLDLDVRARREGRQGNAVAPLQFKGMDVFRDQRHGPDLRRFLGCLSGANSLRQTPCARVHSICPRDLINTYLTSSIVFRRSLKPMFLANSAMTGLVATLNGALSMVLNLTLNFCCMSLSAFWFASNSIFRS
jgi:hypothetical protein